MKLIERLPTRTIAGAWRHETRIAGRPAAEKLRVLARFKAHLLLPWLDELCLEPAPLDAIRSLIGPNLLICSATSCTKEARDGTAVPWQENSICAAFAGWPRKPRSSV